MMEIEVTEKKVEHYLSEWFTLDKYVMQENCINLLFQELCNKNSRLVEVLLKGGDLDLVDRMAVVSFGSEVRRFYSFATKYCSHHFPEAYPIYDSYVDEMLWFFHKRDYFAKFNRIDMKHFPTFVGIIDQFKSHYGLEKFSRKEIDVFLWLAGKKHFPRYKQANRAGSNKRR